jgi:hypothetical protein
MPLEHVKLYVLFSLPATCDSLGAGEEPQLLLQSSARCLEPLWFREGDLRICAKQGGQGGEKESEEPANTQVKCLCCGSPCTKSFNPLPNAQGSLGVWLGKILVAELGRGTLRSFQGRWPVCSALWVDTLTLLQDTGEEPVPCLGSQLVIWVELYFLKRHVSLNRWYVTMTLFGNWVFADVVKLR